MGAAGFVNQVLRNEGFKAGEVVEQEYVALLHCILVVRRILVQLDVEL